MLMAAVQIVTPARAAETPVRPLTLVYYIGLCDGADASDGVTFKVEVGEGGKPRKLIAATHHQAQQWQFCTADLSEFRGRKITVRLVADPGKSVSSDWGAWGDVAIVAGVPAADGAKGLQDPAITPLIVFKDIAQFTTGAIFQGRDLTPLDAGTGGQFKGAASVCGGISRRGFFSHPCYQREFYGCPVYADFAIDLADPSTAGVDLPAARAAFAQTRFSAPGNYAQTPETAAWDDTTKAAQRDAARKLLGELKRAIARKDARFVVPPGHYRFDVAARPDLTVTDASNLEIAASGATFWFESPEGLKFKNCRNVTVRGLTLDYDPVPFSQGVIVAMNAPQSYVVLRIIDGFPLPERKPSDGTLVLPFHADGTMIPHRMDTASSVEDLGERFVRAYLTQGLMLGEPDRSVAPVGVGDVLVFAPRKDVDIASTGCSGMKLDGVTLFASSHMGIIETDGDGGDTYRGCRIVRRPGTARFIACNADGFHSYLMKRGPTLEDCEISYTCDDCVNIHGFLDMVSRAEDPTHLLIITPMGMNFERGSALTFYGHEDLVSGGTAHVTAVEKVTDEAEMTSALAMEREVRCRSFPEKLLWRVTLDAPVTAQRHALVESPDGPCGSGFVVRRGYFHDNNARGILTEASHGTIEDSRFERTGMPGILLSPDLFWIEGPMPRDVAIRRNTFVECNRQLDSRTAYSHMTASICCVVYMHGSQLSAATPASKITIEANTITRPGAAGIFIGNAQYCDVRNNVITNPMFFPSLGNGKDFVGEEVSGGIYVAAAHDIRISGNKITVGTPATCRPIVLGPKADRQTITIRD